MKNIQSMSCGILSRGMSPIERKRSRTSVGIEPAYKGVTPPAPPKVPSIVEVINQNIKANVLLS